MVNLEQEELRTFQVHDGAASAEILSHAIAIICHATFNLLEVPAGLSSGTYYPGYPERLFYQGALDLPDDPPKGFLNHLRSGHTFYLHAVALRFERFTLIFSEMAYLKNHTPLVCL